MVDASTVEPLRVVFYSHDSQGMGHFRRNRALAHALANRLPVLTGRPVTGLLVNGVAGSVTSSLPTGFDVVTLPAVGKTGATYGPRHLEVGLDTVTDVRGQIIRATLLSFRPDLVVVDRHALGVGGELETALRDLRAQVPGAKVVLGLREVLDTPQALVREWQRTPVATVRELYDEIWVYGDPRVHDIRVTGELPLALHDLVRFQGYLSQGRVEDLNDIDPSTPFVLTTVGGGSDGAQVCLAAARAHVPAGHHHVLVTGPQMSDAEHRAVEREAGPRTSVLRSVTDAAGLIRQASALVSMAGYNTVTETLSGDVPALFVPREWPRREQLMRVESLAADGSVDLLRENDLSPTAIGRWWARAVGRRVSRSHLDLGGLRTVARSAADLISGPAWTTADLPRKELSVAV